MILALAGGVGGARLANGLATILPPEELIIVVNTGDDFEHLGLHISPDIDTVTYTLAGLNNPKEGWGLAGESWAFMDALKRLGGESWFQLGDQDMATHVERTWRLKTLPLSAITTEFCARLGVRHRVAPMTDDPVRTLVETDEGQLAFQDYFVRRRCAPRLLGVSFAGLETARPGAALLSALADPELSAIVICPSNPLLSIRPILSLAGVTNLLSRRRVPVVAVSPFIGGKSVKGPAAKIMHELNLPVTPAGLLSFYDGLLDGMVIDRADADLADSLTGCAMLVTDTLMRNHADQDRLASETLDFTRQLSPRQDHKLM
ncbi:MAG: 2-phospho-L-lactate transferase [Gallionella sp.]|nr:2-phospho-L-lactate transferase [Gallionella sp.]